MKKGFILMISALALFSCKHEAVSKELTKGNNIELELLFEKDGCKVYRFLDGDNYVYWSNCEGVTRYRHGSKGSKHEVSSVTDKK
ncbi:DUF4884 domain-containing protein [Elizabethkingia anophelis]|nr:DUF4884 domain-containing protein [Elizabethkingia anophelis]